MPKRRPPRPDGLIAKFKPSWILLSALAATLGWGIYTYTLSGRSCAAGVLDGSKVVIEYEFKD